VLRQAAERGLAVDALSSRYQERATMVAQYVEAYQRYCWPVHSVQDLRLAPFHILATEGAVHVDKTTSGTWTPSAGSSARPPARACK